MNICKYNKPEYKIRILQKLIDSIIMNNLYLIYCFRVKYQQINNLVQKSVVVFRNSACLKIYIADFFIKQLHGVRNQVLKLF